MNETTNGPAWMKVLGAALLASFVGMVVFTVFLVGQIGVSSATLTMLPGVLLLAVGLVMLNASIHVRLTDQIELQFRPIWRRRIAFVDVASVRTQAETWYQFGGVGLRWKPNATGLILGHRPAVVITTRQGYEYVVQCHNAEEVAAAINERLTKK